jgi:hypothetical protein
MEKLYQFKDIIFGYTNDGTDRAITKHQDGNSYISYPNASFANDERVTCFLSFEGKLHALITDDTDTGRLLRLDVLKTGEADTWTEICSIADLDSPPALMEYLEDSIFIFSTSEVWEWDGTSLTSKTTSLPTQLTSIYSSTYFQDKIILLGEGAASNHLVSYDGNTTFETLADNNSAIDFPTGFQPIGKNLMQEYKGVIYWLEKASSFHFLCSYDISDGLQESFLLNIGSYLPTSVLVDRGIVYIGVYNNTTSRSNITTYVPVPFEKEQPLVSGEGRIWQGLKKVTSDPVFLVSEPKLGKVSYFKEYPVLAVLRGKLNPVIKYAKRLEFYSDINDVSALAGVTLKDMIDMLNSPANNFLQVDANNTAKIFPRDLVGYSNKDLEFASSSDYGDQIINEVINVESYQHNFRKIVVNWSNTKWQNNTSVAVGAVEIGDAAVYEENSIFVNDPILAKSIGLYLLDNMDVSEAMSIQLSYAYFMEGGENVSFDVTDDVIEIDKDREWKVIGVVNSKEEMTTTLFVLERSLLEERETA